MLQVENLTKTFKNVNAVTEISFELQEGEILGFLGPNGAGKSTTISMISTLLKPTSGDILLDGNSILKNPQPLRKVLGVVPQEIALYPDLSGYENLIFFGKMYGLKKAELKNRVKEILEVIGLADRAHEKLQTYSGGMKRRINIGVALLHKPRILIMDEPTVGIDPQSRNHILTTVKELNSKGMTILYTSHYMEEVELLCDRIYIMDHGSIIASGTKQQLKELITEANTLNLTVEITTEGFTEALKSHPKIKAVITEGKVYTIALKNYETSILKDLISLAEENQTKIESMQLKTPSLEDVFLQLTGRGLRN
ncbi:ABC transporter ATP-binding protein [Anaerobacillus sp. CMMVII]|uniref:ABC transporter ATP-binding protein n=1 Tax=Anaerobacillus sp. CMMVII TaxID=2755588 RepID=UPI0021B7B484|nr:ABC transporter ATP-binding protein [Anaerobacillus sp. CMMVII]MCT8137993.1 ABC transporter ATP-binding protein [Anaerobacillus sp. CMMVII]